MAERDPVIVHMLGDLADGGLPLIDRLSPGEFLRELPELLEICAVENSRAMVRIDTTNLPAVLDALRANLDATTGGVPRRSGLPHPDLLEQMMEGRQSLEITMSAREMQLLARDLRNGQSQIAAQVEFHARQQVLRTR